MARVAVITISPSASAKVVLVVEKATDVFSLSTKFKVNVFWLLLILALPAVIVPASKIIDSEASSSVSATSVTVKVPEDAPLEMVIELPLKV